VSKFRCGSRPGRAVAAWPRRPQVHRAHAHPARAQFRRSCRVATAWASPNPAPARPRLALPVLQHALLLRERPQPKHPRGPRGWRRPATRRQISRSFEYLRPCPRPAPRPPSSAAWSMPPVDPGARRRHPVATRGRLLAWSERGNVKLAHVTFLVIDDADRFFDMGFIKGRPSHRPGVGGVAQQRQTLRFLRPPCR